jgi:hypothetical protein
MLQRRSQLRELWRKGLIRQLRFDGVRGLDVHGEPCFRSRVKLELGFAKSWPKICRQYKNIAGLAVRLV